MSPQLTRTLSRVLPFLFRQGEQGTELHQDNLKWTLLLVSALIIGFWAYQRTTTLTISDARIASDVVAVSGNRPGWIQAFEVSSGDRVQTGDLLVQIDDRAARLAMDELNLQIEATQARLADKPRSNSDVLQELKRLQLQRRQLALEVEDRQVRSPIDGVIDKTFGHPGEYIAPGRRLVMLHNPDNIWINANIRETELRHIRPGMPAQVKVDAYPDRTFEAEVSRIDNATTSEFALLPNPNPSGNFTKVTQRLQVRLAIEQQAQLLKPGMMVEVTFDLKD